MLERIRTIEGYELVTIQQAAGACGVTYQAVKKWIQNNDLPVIAEIAGAKLVDKNEALKVLGSKQPRNPRSGTPEEITEGASASG